MAIFDPNQGGKADWIIQYEKQRASFSSDHCQHTRKEARVEKFNLFYYDCDSTTDYELGTGIYIDLVLLKTAADQ